MANLTKAFIATTALMTVAGVASAADFSTQVKFNYNKFAPIETTYANFETTAKRACKSDVHGKVIYSLGARRRYLRDCPPELVGRVVDQIGNASLIAFHHERMNQRTYKTIIAENSKAQDKRDS